jgi:hypothetical protein
MFGKSNEEIQKMMSRRSKLSILKWFVPLIYIDVIVLTVSFSLVVWVESTLREYNAFDTPLRPLSAILIMIIVFSMFYGLFYVGYFSGKAARGRANRYASDRIAEKFASGDYAVEDGKFIAKVAGSGNTIIVPVYGLKNIEDREFRVIFSPFSIFTIDDFVVLERELRLADSGASEQVIECADNPALGYAVGALANRILDYYISKGRLSHGIVTL